MNVALRTASTLDEAFSNMLTKLMGSFAIALIDEGVSVIVLSSNDELNEKTQSNAAEVAARGARLIEVGFGRTAVSQLALPEAPDAIMPFLHALGVQMVSYFAALAKGTDVDQPKNLAKSMTVE